MSGYEPIPLPDRADLNEAEMAARSQLFLELMQRRHTLREFSDRPVPRSRIEIASFVRGSSRGQTASPTLPDADVSRAARPCT